MKTDLKIVPSPQGDVTLVTLTARDGARVVLSSIGAGIVSIVVPDDNGEMADVALGYSDPLEYFYDGPCAGKVPGRYANRIARGRFTLDGTVHQLNINNGPNHLHGGPEGFSHKIWECECVGDQVVFTLDSPDGDEHYPGNLTARVAYTWTEDHVLKIELGAVTDRKTVVNLTNHAYFNLSGEGSGTVLDHKLQLMADAYLPTDDTLIPTGEMAPVAGTPMDFTAPRVLRDGIENHADFPAIKYGKGYDNCWVLNGEAGKVNHAARLIDERSGRVLDVLTDQPAVQVYTGNWLAGAPLSKSGKEYRDYDGVAIECQGMPDAPNHDNFPSQVLDVDDEYRRVIFFEFKTIKTI